MKDPLKRVREDESGQGLTEDALVHGTDFHWPDRGFAEAEALVPPRRQ